MVGIATLDFDLERTDEQPNGQCYLWRWGIPNKKFKYTTLNIAYPRYSLTVNLSKYRYRIMFMAPIIYTYVASSLRAPPGFEAVPSRSVTHHRRTTTVG